MSSECPAGVLPEAPCERPGPSRSILEVSPKSVPMPTVPTGIPFIRKRPRLLSKLFARKLQYSKTRVTCQVFSQYEAHRRASLAGLGSEGAAGAAQRASRSLPGSPKQRKQILLAMDKWTHAKNNKKSTKNITVSEKRF